MQSDVQAYLILGANGGVGAALCRRLRKRGAMPILAGRDCAALSKLAEELSAPYVEVDATSDESMRACVETANKLRGRLDGVANCIGAILLKPAHLTRTEEWHSIISTNLASAFYATKYGAKAMMGNGGAIVLVSSSAAQVGLPNHEAISAAKAGVEGLVRSAAASYARHNIRVNCVAPGLLRTKLTASITANDSQLQASLGMHALRRIGEPEEIASCIDWLLSADTDWMTGQVIAVDGGLSTVRPRTVSTAS